jgi:hypothetical protein
MSSLPETGIRPVEGCHIGRIAAGCKEGYKEKQRKGKLSKEWSYTDFF